MLAPRRKGREQRSANEGKAFPFSIMTLIIFFLSRHQLSRWKFILPIINFDDVKEHEREQAQRRAVQMVDAEWRMRERQKKQNEAFIWSPENVAKIIRFNDKLWALMQDVVMDPEEFLIYTRVYN